MLTPEAAWQQLEPHLRPLGIEAADRTAAAGRVLARPVVATADLPATDVSALDGFAFAAPSAGDRFRIVGTTLAGGAFGSALSPGEAGRIMTGAPVPPGALAVLGFEDCASDERSVRPRVATELGAAIRRRGEIFRAGAELLAAGERLSPAALALLASQGIVRVDVSRRPRVEILVTGDEVSRAAGELRAGEVRDSHSDFLVAELRTLGIEPLRGDLVPDDSATLRERLRLAAGRADVVMTTGGVSVGDADLVAKVALELDFTTLFHGVAMQPGKPLFAAARGETVLFGLPGNPGSVMTATWLFVRPALRRLGGEAGGFWSDTVHARLEGELGAGKSRDRFVPARARLQGGAWRARSLSPKGSHDLVAFARANALLRVVPGDPARAAGAACDLLLLGEPG